MKHGEIAPSLIKEPFNENIDFEKLHLKVVRSGEKALSDPFIAGINSFGYGGSNTYALVKNWPRSNKPNHISSPKYAITVLSAMQKNQLERTVKEASSTLSSENLSLSHISYTTTARRSHFRHRVAVTATSVEETVEKLKNAPVIQASKKEKLHTVFICNGMGTAWEGMCQELFHTEPIFRETIKQIDECLKSYVSWSLEEVLNNSLDLMDSAIVQPAIFGCQVGLARLWIHWGVEPDVVIGHSVGEVAAAHIAGYLTLEQAVTVIFYRGKLLSKASGGSMLVVGNMLVTKLEELLIKYENKVCVAAYNSPISCTLSGDSETIDEVQTLLQKKEPETFLRKLNVTTAFHSHHVEPILPQIRESLGGLRKASQPCYKLASTVTGYWATHGDYVSPDYWCNNVRQPVLFDKALKLAVNDNKMNVVFEIGPRPALRNNIQEIMLNVSFRHLASIHTNSEITYLQSALCEAYKLGLDINWEHYHKKTKVTPAAIPILIMQENQNYFESEKWVKQKSGMDVSNKLHMFVSMAVSDGSKFNIDINDKATPFVFDHHVWNQTVPPGAMYAEIAVASIMMVPKINCLLKDICTSVYFHKKLEVQQGENFQLVATVSKSDVKYNMEVKGGDAVYALANAYISEAASDMSMINQIEIKRRSLQNLEGRELYEKLQSAHFSYGPTLTVVKSCHSNHEECISFLEMSSDTLPEYRQTYIHPAVLDGMMQSIAAFDFISQDSSNFMLPVSIEGIRVYGSMERNMFVYLIIQELGDSECILSGTLCNKHGQILVTCSRIRLVSMSIETSLRQVKFRECWKDETENFINNHQPRPEHSKYLIIAKNQTHANSLKQQIHQITKDQSYTEVTLDPGTLVQKPLVKFLHLQFVTGAVIYLQTETFQNTETSNTLEQQTYALCETVVEILKVLQDSEIHIPLYVVTVRAKSASEIPTEPTSPVDYALWGFVRSATTESSVAVTLIDIENVNHKTMNSLANFVHRYTPSNPEWLIRNNTFSCNLVVQSLENGESINGRENSLDKSAHVTLVSSQNDRLTNLKYVYQANKPEKDGITMKLSSVVLPVEQEYAVTTSAIQDKVHTIDEFNTHGHPVLILTSVGYISSSTNKLEKVILYPHPCQSLVTVPEECIADVKDLPRDAVTILPQLFIIQEICRKLDAKKYNKIMVLREDNCPSFLADVTLKILPARYKERNFVIEISKLNNKNEKLTSNSKNVVLLLLSKPSNTNAIMNLISAKTTTILAVEELVGSQTMSHFRHKGFVVEVIQMNHNFSPPYLRKMAPTLFKWLRRFSSFPSFNALPPLVSISDENNNNNNNNKCHNFHQTTGTEPKALPRTVCATKETLFRRNAKYLLIGGLKGLGWDLAEYMANQGAGVLICVSRSSPTLERIREIAKLERKTGVQLFWAECDISSYEKTQEMLNKVRHVKSEIPIKGIFHSAVVYADRVFKKMTKTEFLKATGPKIAGAWNFHLLTRNENLDYFVLHSSIAALLGNAGQTNYSAANGFLDGLSIYRRQMGLAGQTISWGPLQAGILERDSSTEEILKSDGWKLLDKETIKQCFEYTLLTNKVNTIFFSADNATLADTFDVRRTENGGFVLEDRLLGPRLAEKLKNGLLPFDTSMETSNTILSNEARPEQRIDVVKSVVASILGLPESDIDKSTPLMEIGINSMHAIILRNKMKKNLKTNVSVEQLLHPQATVESLANFASDPMGSGQSNSQNKPNEQHVSTGDNTASDGALASGPTVKNGILPSQLPNTSVNAEVTENSTGNINND